MRGWKRLVVWAVVFGAAEARADCWRVSIVPVNGGQAQEVTVECYHVYTPPITSFGCCPKCTAPEPDPKLGCATEVDAAWLVADFPSPPPGPGAAPLNVSFSGNCGPCCVCEPNGSYTITGQHTFQFACGSGSHTISLLAQLKDRVGGLPFFSNLANVPIPDCQLGSCVTTGDHRGDGCCDPALNKDPAQGNNLNDACIALFDKPGDRRNCCRPAGMLPPGGDPTHPRDGHPPLPGAWPLPGWCDRCGGGGGGGCTSDADCGGGLHCCSGACQAEPCLPPPPSGFNAVIEVYGSEGHRWDARFKQGKVRVPMSFRLWDPAAGRYVWERAGQDGPDAPPQRPCKNRAGKVLDANLACWSRPWLVPDFDENPTGIVRTHRLRLEGPRTVYVQPECGVEFNAVLNPAKLAAAFRGPVVTFDPKLGLRVDMNNSDKCPVRQNVCADGRPCGVCPNGMPPDLDGTCPGGGTPSGTACPADGSTCEAACVYTIDLTFMYERRQTPSWCYEDSGRDTACAVPGDLSSCVSQPGDPRRDVRPSGAVDDWRVSSPWCWEQTKPKPPDIGQPASFKDPPNCTIDADRKCIDPAYLNTKCP